MKTILISIFAALSLFACGVSDDVTPFELQSVSELAGSAGGTAVPASAVDSAYIDVAALHLEVEPRTCLMDPSGPVTCCNQNGNTLCCFFFRTGITRCTPISGPPIQTP